MVVLLVTTEWVGVLDGKGLLAHFLNLVTPLARRSVQELVRLALSVSELVNGVVGVAS